MPAAQPRPKRAVPTIVVAPPGAAPATLHAPVPSSSAARLADELAVPAPSPVHQLQAELVQLTTTADPQVERLYPGWFRLGFPLVSSALLWAAILWSGSHLL